MKGGKSCGSKTTKDIMKTVKKGGKKGGKGK